jgi:hypothetical protein
MAGARPALAQVEYKIPGVVDIPGLFADLTKHLVARDAVFKWWVDTHKEARHQAYCRELVYETLLAHKFTDDELEGLLAGVAFSSSCFPASGDRDRE